MKGNIEVINYTYAVIIPNYNKARYLKQCILSISNQSLRPNEIIVVDDCSTDNSLEILKDIANDVPSLKIIQLKKNGGVSNARNEGARNAHSQYLKFIDADDFFFGPDNCKKEMDLIRIYKQKKGEDILAYSAVVFSNNDGTVTSKPDIRKKHKFINGNATYDLLARLRFSSIANNFMVSRQVFDLSGGFNYPYNFYEDYEILIRLSEHVRFFFSGEYGRVYRFTPDGLSKQPRQNHVRALENIFNMYYFKLNLWGKMNTKARIALRDAKLIFSQLKRE